MRHRSIARACRFNSAGGRGGTASGLPATRRQGAKLAHITRAMTKATAPHTARYSAHSPTSNKSVTTIPKAMIRVTARTVFNVPARPQPIATGRQAFGIRRWRRTFRQLCAPDRTNSHPDAIRTGWKTMFSCRSMKPVSAKLADMQGACSNQILTHLEGWNKLLQSSSLARKKPEIGNEGEFEDAPSDHKPVIVRRRRKA